MLGHIAFRNKIHPTQIALKRFDIYMHPEMGFQTVSCHEFFIAFIYLAMQTLIILVLVSV